MHEQRAADFTAAADVAHFEGRTHARPHFTTAACGAERSHTLETSIFISCTLVFMFPVRMTTAAGSDLGWGWGITPGRPV